MQQYYGSHIKKTYKHDQKDTRPTIKFVPSLRLNTPEMIEIGNSCLARKKGRENKHDFSVYGNEENSKRKLIKKNCL